MSYSLATLDISRAAYDEIAAKLRAAGYEHVFTVEGLINMICIGLTATPAPIGPTCTCLTGQLGPDYCEIHAA